MNDFRSRGKTLSETENIFVTATMQFRENIKAMYSLPVSLISYRHQSRLIRVHPHHSLVFLVFSPVPQQKPTIGYKGLMTGYQNKVMHLAGNKKKEEVQLVVNLFQSVLDGFIRGEMKKEEAEPVKVKHSIIQSHHSSYSTYVKTVCLCLFSAIFQPAKARKKRRKKDKSVSVQLRRFFIFYFFLATMILILIKLLSS